MSENTQNPVSNQEVLTAVQAISHGLSSLDGKFSGLDQKFDGLDRKLTDHIEESKRIHDDILSAVNTSFIAVETELYEIKDRLGGVEDRLGSVENKLVTKEEFKQAMIKVVTKEYLDDKLSDLKGDLVGLVRKEDHKVDTVVTILHDHRVLTVQDLEQIDQVGLFPKTKTKMTAA